MILNTAAATALTPVPVPAPTPQQQQRSTHLARTLGLRLAELRLQRCRRRLGRAEDKSVVAGVVVALEERRGLGVRAAHDDRRCTHDVGLHARSNQASDVRLAVDEDLASHVPALFVGLVRVREGEVR